MFIKIYEDILPPVLCDELINFFESNVYYDTGRIKQGAAGDNVNPKIKDSWDLYFIDEHDIDYGTIISSMDRILTKVMLSYYDEFYVDKFKQISEVDIMSGDELLTSRIPIYNRCGNYLMKRYDQGIQGYHHWHCDWGLQSKCIMRQLVVQFYLNDVEEGGETEFLYQKLKIKPKGGTCVVFPAQQTHIHKGHIPISNDKYIMNAWINKFWPVPKSDW